MIGRAGRPQFDTEGIAVILTHESCAQKYRTISNGLEIIESTLRDKIPEHLNSEIVLGTITDISQSIYWYARSWRLVGRTCYLRTNKLVATGSSQRIYTREFYATQRGTAFQPGSLKKNSTQLSRVCFVRLLRRVSSFEVSEELVDRCVRAYRDASDRYLYAGTQGARASWHDLLR